jgi:hypothetical protein
VETERNALHWLTSDDIARMTHRARQAGQPGWTGTSGTLAADVMRLLGERQRLLVKLAHAEQSQDAMHWRD